MPACFSWPKNLGQALSKPHGRMNSFCIWIIILHPIAHGKKRGGNKVYLLPVADLPHFGFPLWRCPLCWVLHICPEMPTGTCPFTHINSCISYTLFGLCFFLLKYIFWEEFHIIVHGSALECSSDANSEPACLHSLHRGT